MRQLGKAHTESTPTSSCSDTASAMRMREAIERGELLVIVGDRTPVHSAGRTVSAEFMGASAEFAQGPYLLASLLDCPVYLFFCLCSGKRHSLHLEFFAERIFLPRGKRLEAMAVYAQQYAQRLQHYALLAPLQWFNFFDFWAPPAPAKEHTS